MVEIYLQAMGHYIPGKRLTNEDVMYSLRSDLGIGVVFGDPGKPTGITAKCKIAELLGIEINSVNYFKSLL